MKIVRHKCCINIHSRFRDLLRVNLENLYLMLGTAPNMVDIRKRRVSLCDPTVSSRCHLNKMSNQIHACNGITKRVENVVDDNVSFID